MTGLSPDRLFFSICTFLGFHWCCNWRWVKNFQTRTDCLVVTWLTCSHDGLKCLQFWPILWRAGICRKHVWQNTQKHMHSAKPHTRTVCNQSTHQDTNTVFITMFKTQQSMVFHCLQVNCTGHQVDWRQWKWTREILKRGFNCGLIDSNSCNPAVYQRWILQMN